MRGCFHCRSGGLCLISLGIGVLLALVLPVGVIIFVSGMALIFLGCCLLRR